MKCKDCGKEINIEKDDYWCVEEHRDGIVINTYVHCYDECD